jgi:hypothetical protein
MATLREIQAFITDIESRDPEGRSITQEDFANVLQSLAKVGGAMAYEGAPSPVVIGAGWNRLDVFANSFDTQGLLSGITDIGDPGGWYEVRNQGAGDYTVSAMVRFTADTAGLYELRATKATFDGANWISDFSVYQDAVTVVGGEEVVLQIAAAIIENAVTGDRLQMEVRGPNPAIASPVRAQWGAQR